jgi:hypothetical protein
VVSWNNFLSQLLARLKAQIIIERCLEKQPDNRFQSAKDLAFAPTETVTLPISRNERMTKREWKMNLVK